MHFDLVNTLNGSLLRDLTIGLNRGILKGKFYLAWHLLRLCYNLINAALIGLHTLLESILLFGIYSAILELLEIINLFI